MRVPNWGMTALNPPVGYGLQPHVHGPGSGRVSADEEGQPDLDRHHGDPEQRQLLAGHALLDQLQTRHRVRRREPDLHPAVTCDT